MREKHQKAFPLIFDKRITVIPSTKPMQERESGQRDDNMGRDTPSRILDEESFCRSINGAVERYRFAESGLEYSYEGECDNSQRVRRR